jgi:Ca2+-binding RTX toxin-like protein
MPRRLLPFLVLAAALLAAPAAHASTVGVQGTTLTVTGAARETNRFTVSQDSDEYRVTDSRAQPTAGAGCTLSGRTVACPRAGLTDLVADAGDRNDRIEVRRDVTLRGRLRGGTGNDALVGGGGPDELDGGSGRDVASYSSRTDPVTVTLGGGQPDGAPGEGDDVRSVEQLIGTGGSDDLTGNGSGERLEGRAGDDRVHGNGGNDTLIGGSGDDVVTGGTGNDVLLASSTRDGTDVLDGGDGTDRADYGPRAAGVVVDPDGRADDGERPGGRLGFTGAVPAIAGLTSAEGDNVLPDVESVRGGRGDDVLAAGRSAGRIEGREGTDVVGGGPGDDLLDGGSGFDRLLGRDQNADELRCGTQTDRVFADARDQPNSDCEATSRSLAIGVAPLQRSLDDGALPIRVTCPAQAAVRCVGAMRLVTLRRLRTSGGRSRTVTLGSARISAPAGRSVDTRVTLTNAGRAALDRLGGATRVRVVPRGRDEAGAARRSSTRFVLRG